MTERNDITIGDIVRWALGVVATLAIGGVVGVSIWTVTTVSSYGQRMTAVETKVDMILHQMVRVAKEVKDVDRR